MYVFHQIFQLQQKTKRTDYNTLGPFHNRYSLKKKKEEEDHSISFFIQLACAVTRAQFWKPDKVHFNNWGDSGHTFTLHCGKSFP